MDGAAIERVRVLAAASAGVLAIDGRSGARAPASCAASTSRSTGSTSSHPEVRPLLRSLERQVLVLLERPLAPVLVVVDPAVAVDRPAPALGLV